MPLRRSEAHAVVVVRVSLATYELFTSFSRFGGARGSGSASSKPSNVSVSIRRRDARA